LNANIHKYRPSENVDVIKNKGVKKDIRERLSNKLNMGWKDKLEI
jgi:hypothetical protein